jgi:hypothetical protein
METLKLLNEIRRDVAILASIVLTSSIADTKSLNDMLDDINKRNRNEYVLRKSEVLVNPPKV